MAGTSEAAIKRVAAYPFGSIYDNYVAKVTGKGKSVADLRFLIEWLTGYDGAALDKVIKDGSTMADFFDHAPLLNPNAELITGVICGVRVEDIENPFMQQVRWLDKIVDELARSKKLESITRNPVAAPAKSQLKTKPTSKAKLATKPKPPANAKPTPKDDTTAKANVALADSPVSRIPRTSPEAAGVSRRNLEKLVKDLDDLHGVHSLLVLRGGQVVADAVWEPYQQTQPQALFSATKTFAAYAIGCAVAEGLLTVEDKVIDLLPDDAPAKPSAKLQQMKVKHLLTMTTGHATEPVIKSGNWAKSTLAHPVKFEPGTHFLYNSMASHLLSVIITKLTGKKLIDYLTPRLFKPLGIDVDSANWETDLQGNNTGGWGLSLMPEDLALFGLLLLQRGKWKGKQLIPAAWVDTMMSNLVDPAVQGWGPDWSVGYGYQMWQCRKGTDAARADGAFGQFIIVWPDYDAVIVTTAGVGSGGSAGTQALLDRIFDNLDGAFDAVPDGAAPATAQTKTLTSKVDATSGTIVEELSLPMPQGQPSSGIVEKINGAIYQIDGTTNTVTVTQNGDLLELALSSPPATTHVAAYGRWHRFTAPNPEANPRLNKPPTGPAASSYAWTKPDTLEVKSYGTAVPFGWTYTLTWSGRNAEKLTIAIDQNVSFGDTKILRATGQKYPRQVLTRRGN